MQPWTLFDELLMIFADEDESVHVVTSDHNFQQDDFRRIVDDFLAWGLLGASIDSVFILPLFMLSLVYFMGRTSRSEKQNDHKKRHDNPEKVKGE